MFFTLKSSLSIVPYSTAIAFGKMWKKIWRKEKREAVEESLAAAAGAQWVAVESSTEAAGWSAAAEAQCVVARWSTAAESSTMAAGMQRAVVESSVAAGLSTPEYRLDNFEIFERERERGIPTLTHIGSVNFELDTRSTLRCPIGHLGWGREGGGGGVCPTPPHKPRCLIVKENTF